MPRVLLLITHASPGGAQDTVTALADGLPQHGFEVDVATGPGPAGDAGLEHEARVLPHLRRELRPGTDLRAYGEIRRLIAAGNYDVVHTHSSKAGVLGRLAAVRNRVRAIVHTSHGLPINPDMGSVQYNVLRIAERVATKACHRVVAVSRSTADELERLHIAPRDKITVIPSGVQIPATWSPQRRAVRTKLGVPEDSFVVGWVGRHFPQKRPDLIVRTARAVLEQVPEATFLLAGDGPLLGPTRDSAADDARIRILGHLSNVEELYEAIDVFLLASAWEGLPRSVLEALARGIPAVSTNVGGVTEVLRHGENGFVVSPGDTRALAEGLITLARDPDLLRRMGSAARSAISQAYSEDRMIAAHVRLYEDLLGRATAAG
ncbi:MAG: glycosyltransferase family 4 protein [Actinomycetota bacterium]